MTNTTLGYVKGLGYVEESYGDWLTNIVESRGKIISPRDEAYARLQTQATEKIGQSYGTQTSAGFEYAKDQLPIVRLHSRLLEKAMAERAVAANKNGNYFCTPTTKEYEASLKEAEKEMKKDPKDWNVFTFPSPDSITISDKEHWNLYQAFLKDQATPYFELNGPITVHHVSKNVVDARNGTLLSYLWFGSLDSRCGFVCDDCFIDFNYETRWVSRKETAEGTQKISSEEINVAYTQKEINKYSDILQKVRTGELPNSRLEELVEFLERLKQ